MKKFWGFKHLDKAERLHTLAANMFAAAETLQIGGNNWNGYTFADSLPGIISSLNYESYISLNDHFLTLCHGINEDISIVVLKKESLRNSWKNYLRDVQAIFNPENFGAKAINVYRRHFSEHNLNALITISERIQTDGLQDSTKEDLKAAFDAVEEAINAISEISGMDRKIASLLRHYLSQMRSVVDHFEIFGEDNFWNVYKETFATFVQVHSTVLGSENADDIKRKIAKVIGCLTSKSVAGVSLIANVATIAAFVLPNVS